MFAWFLNLIYLLIILAASPVLLYRSLRYGKYREGWGEKFFGRLPRRVGWAVPTKPSAERTSLVGTAHPTINAHPHAQSEIRNPKSEIAGPRVWFHAVSVGEVLQLQTVLREFEAVCPQAEIVVTTTTATGLAVAKEKFPRHHVCYFPLDFTWAVRNAADRIRPDLVVLVELELWPNFIREVHRSGIPLALINGRISEKSFRGYRKIRPLMRRVLSRFSRLAVQNETYAERLRQLGAPLERIDVTGSIKFDGIATDRDNPQTAELRAAFGLEPEEPVFIAGSTHPPEEEIALDAWQEVRKDHPNLRLILIPRHKERFDEVARLVASRELPLLRRRRKVGWAVRTNPGAENASMVGTAHPTDHKSEIRNPKSEIPPILLLDTLGELSACWGLADVAFVGGSLTSRGGQNMIEPAAYGAAVTFGPNTRNFRDVVETLLDGDAARVVQNRAELAGFVRESIESPNEALARGERAREIVLAQQGATMKTVAKIAELLPPPAETLRHDDVQAA